MALTVPNLGAQELLRRALNYSAADDVKIGLYSNNVTIAETSVIGDVTAATFTGYDGLHTLTGTSFTVTNADPASGSYAQQTWTSSAGSQNQDIYGYYVVNNAGTILLWIEAFSDGPYNIANDGDSISVTPIITLD